jgi:aldose 1-epimerase
VSIHPYLVAGDGPVDDWVLDLPAAQVLDVDPDRLLPAGLQGVADAGLDFRGGAPIGARAIDHAVGAVAFHAGTGHARAELRAGDGRGVAMTWDRSCPWVQIHTTDLPGRSLHRSALALEPMTCPPDAFNSGTDVVALAPGRHHVAWWRVQALGPDRG